MTRAKKATRPIASAIPCFSASDDGPPPVPLIEPTMTRPTAMSAIAPNNVPRSKLLACLRSSNLDPFRGLRDGGLRLGRLLARRDSEVDLEDLAHDGRGDAAAVPPVLDEDGEGDRRILHGRVADEPRVIAERLVELVRIDSGGGLVHLHRAGLADDGDAGEPCL